MAAVNSVLETKMWIEQSLPYERVPLGVHPDKLNKIELPPHSKDDCLIAFIGNYAPTLFVHLELCAEGHQFSDAVPVRCRVVDFGHGCALTTSRSELWMISTTRRSRLCARWRLTRYTPPDERHIVVRVDILITPKLGKPLLCVQLMSHTNMSVVAVQSPAIQLWTKPSRVLVLFNDATVPDKLTELLRRPYYPIVQERTAVVDCTEHMPDALGPCRRVQELRLALHFDRAAFMDFDHTAACSRFVGLLFRERMAQVHGCRIFFEVRKDRSKQVLSTGVECVDGKYRLADAFWRTGPTMGTSMLRVHPTVFEDLSSCTRKDIMFLHKSDCEMPKSRRRQHSGNNIVRYTAPQPDPELVIAPPWLTMMCWHDAMCPIVPTVTTTQ